MSKKSTQTWALGLVLGVFIAALSATLTPTVALAQTAPTGAAPQTAARPQTSVPRPGEPVAIVARNDLTGGLRGVAQGDNSYGVISREAYLANGYGTDAEFNGLVDNSRHVCMDSGAYIREAVAIARGVNGLGPQWDALYPRLDRWADAQNRASRARTGNNVIQSVVYCAVPFLMYACPSVVGGSITSEMRGRADDQGQNINRDASRLNFEGNQWQLRGMILNMHGEVEWAGAMQDLCLRAYPDAVIAQGGVTLDQARAQLGPIGAPSWGRPWGGGSAANDNGQAANDNDRDDRLDRDRDRRRGRGSYDDGYEAGRRDARR